MNKLEYFKQKVLSILNGQEEGTVKDFKKSFTYIVDVVAKGNFPVGTIREWKGKKYIKVAPGKWRPKYDSNSRGAKLSIAALKRKAKNCKTSQELLQLVLENRSRFSDKNGHPLPFVQELRSYVSGLNNKIEKQAGADDTYPEKDYPEYKGKGQEAVNFIVKNKGGQVRGAFNRPEIGDIDVVWGKITNAEKHTGYGLSHIIDKHGMEAVNKIGEIIKNGEVYRDKRNRLCIKNNNAEIALKEDWFKHKKIWIVTSYNITEGSNKTITSNTHYTGETLPATSTISIPESDKKSSDIMSKTAQWQKEGRKIITDEHGLNFYEGMTPSEKIEWIQAEIKRLQEHAKSPFLGQGGVIRYAKDDFYEGLDKDYYKNKYGAYDYKKYIKRDLKKFINKEMREAESRYKKRIKEYEAEIKEYQEDIKYYEKQISSDLKDKPPKTTSATTSKNGTAPISTIPKSGEKSNGIMRIRKKYESSKSITGNKKTVTLPNGTKIKCHYKLVEADAPTASHDENTYSPTKGFPTSKEGKTVNDRDYQNDTDAQESVRKIAANFNSLALESPPIVTKDGIVISGNNRTMSSKLAAKNGTDTVYLDDLKEMIDEYGLEEDDLDGFKHPRLILEIDAEHEGEYTTEEFAQFNRDTKKTMSNVEKAVKITKTLNEEKIQSIASELSDYETMGELYADAKGCQRFVAKLIDAEIIGDNEKAQYLKSDGTLNDTGKDFAETVLVGSVLNEDNIRKLDSAGGKRIRQKLVRALLPLVENKGTGREYSFNKELNEAVDIAVNVAKHHDTYPDVETYLAQRTLFGESKPDEVTGKLAKLIHDEGEKAFASRMKNLGAGLKHSAEGEMDIFLGGVETKQSLMERFLTIQKAITDILTNLYTKERTIHSIVADELQKQCG